MRPFQRIAAERAWVVVAIASVLLPAANSALAQSTTTSVQATWSHWIDIVFGEKKPRDPGPGGRGGPRPANLCWLTPSDQVWHSQPLFVWSGNFRVIGLRPAESDTLIWRIVAPTEPDQVNRLAYNGKPLEPGQHYEWVFFFDQSSTVPLLKVPFQLVEAKKHAAIAKELTLLNDKLEAEKAAPEARALQRAMFFANQQLWADAMQEIYAVGNPSIELQQVAQQVQQELCSRK